MLQTGKLLFSNTRQNIEQFFSERQWGFQPKTVIIGQILTPFHQQRQAEGMTWNNNDLNHVADQRFSLKQWFAAVAHSGTLR